MSVLIRLSTLLGALLLGATLAPVPAHAGTVPAEPAAAVVGAADPVEAGPTQRLGTVTLITGDQVTVRRVGRKLLPQVTPAPGRHGVQFATSNSGDKLYVVPSDAQPLVNVGRLDLRLFDVGTLLRDGYADDRRPELPLLARGDTAALRAAGGTPSARVESLGLTALHLPKQRAAEFWASWRPERGSRVWLDGMRHPSLDHSVAQIGAPAAWEAGYTGENVRVAVLDTGIDSSHPDFKGRIAASRNFTSDPGTRDTEGHGTHVASIIAGSGAASEGKYRGVAPGADLLVGKVCAAYGCPESAILAGMEWAATSGATVVNLSLGGQDTAGDDPLEQAVNALSDRYGTLFVIAAGNDGRLGTETVSSPASADAALAVGAVDREDGIADFSSRGPRLSDGALKPEIVAPGVQITAARSRHMSSGVTDRYVAFSGTSMATPHVVGAAAILAQRHPDWTGAQLKAALMASAEPLDLGVYEQGAGRVDVARAVTQSAYAIPAAISVGRAAWPHEDDPAVTRTVTYRNPGEHPLTLDLTVRTTGPDQAPAPDGMFRLSSDRVTVPAGGSAEVEVTVDTAVPAAEGSFGAWILATGAEGLRVVTPVAVDREPESYDLTVRHLDGSGEPTDAYVSFLWGVDAYRYRPLSGVNGVVTLRVRAGRYHVDGAITTPRPDGRYNSAKLVHPTVEVRGDTTVVLDSRQARPIRVTFDRPGVEPRAVGVGYGRINHDSAVYTGVLGDDFARILTAQIGDPVPAYEMSGDLGGMWAVPDRQGEVERSPVTYSLTWFQPGQLTTGFDRHVVDSDLATVTSTYRAQTNGKRATKLWIARDPGFENAVGFGLPFALPWTRTEFHNVEGAQWSGEFEQWSLSGRSIEFETRLSGDVVDHQPGQAYREDWNSAAFGPGFGEQNPSSYRTGDFIGVTVPLFSDSTPGHYGWSNTDSGSTSLYLWDTLLGESPVAGSGGFEVPAEPGHYRLETHATRSGVSDLSTEVSAVWTFTSERPADDPVGKGKGGRGTPLPLLAVRFAPPVDDQNRVAGDAALVPVTVQMHPGAPASELTRLTVEVSVDDGDTWRKVEVSQDPDGVMRAHVGHPSGTRFVSLRASAADSAGNTVEQTIIRAYRMG